MEILPRLDDINRRLGFRNPKSFAHAAKWRHLYFLGAIAAVLLGLILLLNRYASAGLIVMIGWGSLSGVIAAKGYLHERRLRRDRQA